jgi:hypothetical protein
MTIWVEKPWPPVMGVGGITSETGPCHDVEGRCIGLRCVIVAPSDEKTKIVDLNCNERRLGQGVVRKFRGLTLENSASTFSSVIGFRFRQTAEDLVVTLQTTPSATIFLASA